LAGLGLAVPFELWNWLDRLDAPAHEMQRWKGLDLAERLTALTGLAVFPGNDGTLACAAETLFGCGSGLTDFAYFNIGSFLGGGIVLNGVVYPGRTGNAGALASLPVGPRVGAQLLETASLYALERDLIAAGYESEALWQAEDADWDRFGSVPERWIGETVQALALASVAVCSVIDFEAVVIDGRVPSQIRSRLRAGVSETLRELDTQGLVLPRIVSGTMGRRAGVVGAAYQPILRRYLHGGAGLV
jgi:predicted NBD/HSP70 family sugar kinase